MPEHRTNLETLRNQLHKAVRQIEEHPGQTIGRENQLIHARTRLANTEVALAASPKSKPFPDGRDLSKPADDSSNHRTVLDV